MLSIASCSHAIDRVSRHYMYVGTFSASAHFSKHTTNTCKMLAKLFCAPGNRQSPIHGTLDVYTYLGIGPTRVTSTVSSPSPYVTVKWFVSDSFAKVHTTLLEAPTTTYELVALSIWQICMLMKV